MDNLGIAEIMLGLIVGLSGWNLRETYAINGRLSRIEGVIADNIKHLADHEHRIRVVEHKVK